MIFPWDCPIQTSQRQFSGAGDLGEFRQVLREVCEELGHRGADLPASLRIAGRCPGDVPGVPGISRVNVLIVGVIPTVGDYIAGYIPIVGGYIASYIPIVGGYIALVGVFKYMDIATKLWLMHIPLKTKVNYPT